MFEDLLPAVERGIMEAAGSIPVVFKGIERTLEKGNSTQSPSRHDAHELIYMRGGKIELGVDSRKAVLVKGDSLVIRPYMPHTVRILEGTADILVLYFGFARPVSAWSAPIRQAGGPGQADTPPMPASGISGLSPGHTLRSTDIAPRTLEQFINFAYGRENREDDKIVDPFILIRGKSRQDIAALAGRILHEDRLEAYGRELMMQLLAMELLVTLARALREEWEESLRVRSGKARELVRIAREFIVDNHEHDISIADVAGYVFLSQGYFTRAFREDTGMSPMAFLMQVRVGHACKLLEQNEIKVSGVAAQVGFSSPQRFNAAFRKHLGMTPMAYRRQILEKKQAAR